MNSLVQEEGNEHLPNIAPTSGNRAITIDYWRGSERDRRIFACIWEAGTADIFTTDPELAREIKARIGTSRRTYDIGPMQCAEFVLHSTWREIRQLVDDFLAHGPSTDEAQQQTSGGSEL